MAATMNSVKIVPMTSEHRQSVINLMMKSFFIQEPLNSVLNFDLPDEVLPWTNQMLDIVLKDDCSFVALEDEQLVGFIMNDITRKNAVNNIVTSSEKLNIIFKLIDQIILRNKLCDEFGVDQLLHCEIINIDESQRGKNLSHLLVSASLERAVSLGIQAASVVCSSLFSRKAFQKYGFHIVDELLYKDSGVEIFNTLGIHDRLSLLAKKL